MPGTRDCPMCGGTMRRKITEQLVQVRGNPRPTKRTLTEWICPDCDYFEEADKDQE